jgi:hypothetical protein
MCSELYGSDESGFITHKKILLDIITSNNTGGDLENSKVV